ncbi:MAG TPA: hypothetical protein GXZ64_02265 [Clostridiaceae bacterium]|nr:hypothetical protein [Clostridiaceae bacterium]
MNQLFEPHMYMICYPNSALVLSQLSPENFGARYNYGSSSYHAGKLIFAEIDIDYRNDYFEIERALERLKPHEDGSPKATRYISSYRVLEHIEIDAIRTLYLANADGTCFPLEAGHYEPRTDEPDLKVYAEITPLTMLTLSKLNLREFGQWFTDPHNQLAVPRILYLQVALDIDGFLEEFERHPFAPPPLEGVHPSKLRDAILEMRRRKEKDMKGLTLDMAFTKESYRKISPGIMVIDRYKEKFFPMPSLTDISDQNYRFYRGM